MKPLVKICATGNDFLLLDQRQKTEEFDPRKVVAWCQRQIGFGADGFVVLRAHPQHAFEWVFYNSDGGEAELCGNAARAVARYFAYETGETQFSFLTRVGTVHAIVDNAKDLSGDVTVSLPRWKNAQAENDFFFVNTGVPHAVVVTPALNDLSALKNQALKIKALPQFQAHGVNVTFRTPLNGDALQSVTYERGVENFTLSCGTGAIASAVSAAEGKSTFKFSVEVPGGKLRVDARENAVLLSGEATLIGTCLPGVVK